RGYLPLTAVPIFFFSSRRRHTRFSRDWSSDVCSSDLAELLGARGFTHSVASGEPGADSMLLWARYVPAAGGDEVQLQAEVALDHGFSRVVAGGTVRTGAYREIGRAHV